MKRTLSTVGLAAPCLIWAVQASAATLKCPPDSVKVGNVCIDLYEASVWQIAPSKAALVKKVQSGKVTLAELLTMLGVDATAKGNRSRPKLGHLCKAFDVTVSKAEDGTTTYSGGWRALVWT